MTYLRLATPEDIPFIYSTWLKSFKSDSKEGKSMRTTIFMKYYVKVIDHILQLPDTVINIACDKEDPFVIHGYIVCNKTTIHYIYVKEVLRRLGLSKALIASQNLGDDVVYTHKTNMIAPIVSKLETIDYNPLLLYKGV